MYKFVKGQWVYLNLFSTFNTGDRFVCFRRNVHIDPFAQLLRAGISEAFDVAIHIPGEPGKQGPDRKRKKITRDVFFSLENRRIAVKQSVENKKKFDSLLDFP